MILRARGAPLEARQGAGKLSGAYLNSTGTVVAAFDFSPYGNGMAVTPNYQSYPIGFSGQFMDWETGLVYYGLRYYAAKHGRFINRDPIEEFGGNNLYGFVNNNPINRRDHLGLTDDLVEAARAHYSETEPWRQTWLNLTMAEMVNPSPEPIDPAIKFNLVSPHPAIITVKITFDDGSTITISTATKSPVVTNPSPDVGKGSPGRIGTTAPNSGVPLGRVIIGEFQSPLQNSVQQLALAGSYWDNATPEKIAAAYGAAWYRNNRSTTNDPLIDPQTAAVLNAFAGAIERTAVTATKIYAGAGVGMGGGMVVNTVVRSPVGREVAKGLVDMAVDFVVPELPDYDPRRFRPDPPNNRPHIEAPADTRPPPSGGPAPGPRPRPRLPRF
jgi:RHS repeat-associated protein